jgi:site-specific recombinase XerD
VKTVRRLPDFLTPREQDQALDTLAADQTPIGQRDHALVATALLTGLRADELVRLRLDELRLADGVLRVHRSKGLKDRELPIVRRLAKILRRYLDEVWPTLAPNGSDYVFPVATGGSGRPMDTRSLRLRIHKLLTPIVGRRVWPHLLRHSFASRLRFNRGDLQIIQEALGHAQISTTTIYAHFSTPDRTAELARLLQ